MSLWEKISNLISGSDDDDSRGYRVYVRCNRCHESIQMRVDLFNDLSDEYSNGEKTLFTRKTIMGSGDCFERIQVELIFDKDRRLMDRTIEGGEFISAEVFLEENKASDNNLAIE